MTPTITLTLTSRQHEQLRGYLFPGDGKEAVALLLCGYRAGERRHRLLVREVHCVDPRGYSERSGTHVTWLPESVEPLLERATRERLSVVKVHCHPNGYPRFSQTDDVGDTRLLPMLQGWVEGNLLHGSVVMLPDGQMFGRVVTKDRRLVQVAAINVIGDDLHFSYSQPLDTEVPSFLASHAQAFDEGTIERVRRLSVAVVGCSGTGSPVIEQLLRLGVGEIVLVDDDRMEDRNVNRILNSTRHDVEASRFKVDVQADAIERTDLGTRVIRLRRNVWDVDVVRAIAQCDVLFGCVDTVDGRYLLNTLATYYLMPYFDVGVRLDAVRGPDGVSRIREACGTIHYLQPGRSSFLTRGLFSLTDVAAAGLRRTDPKAHATEVRDGYIRGVPEHRPAVVTVNMLAAAIAVHELLARLHPYREEPNAEYASVVFSLASMELIPEGEDCECELLADRVGLGDTVPLLGFIELAERRAS
jgi:ThiF family/Prokaryotic homologs of the JAB domain